MTKLTLYCFRDHDLRLADNVALNKAITHAHTHRMPLALLLCNARADETLTNKRSAFDFAYDQAIASLQQRIHALGGQLNITSLNMHEAVTQLCNAHDIKAVFWSRRYSPKSIAQDSALLLQLRAQQITAISSNSALLFEPFETRTLKTDATPYKVFTPFANNLIKELPHLSSPLSAPTDLTQTVDLGMDDNALATNKPNWAKHLLSHWSLSESHAQQSIANWLNRIDTYQRTRNLPALVDGTSKLSPYLRLGLCSPKQILHAINAAITDSSHSTNSHTEFKSANAFTKDTLTFVKELIWREFAYQILYHFPDTLERPFNPRFAHFPWRTPEADDDLLRAWQQGRTGVPIVDAGMRELWHTGWMHNRVRMIVASWLCKNMGLHWHVGAKWFMHTLIDADLASNTLGWQWVAGCGVDAAPYFRIFNPILQAKKFDPQAEYVKKWLPELNDLPVEQCFEPWRFTDHVKAPILDISDSRKAALEHYKQLP